MKIIHCAGCKVKVAEISAGSKIKKRAVMLCDKCEERRKVAELSSGCGNIFTNIFKDCR